MMNTTATAPPTAACGVLCLRTTWWAGLRLFGSASKTRPNTESQDPLGPHDDLRSNDASGHKACPPLAATFPPFRWFELAQRPASMVCAHEHYVKQSLRNRVLLVSGQGPVSITLPVRDMRNQEASPTLCSPTHCPGHASEGPSNPLRQHALLRPLLPGNRSLGTCPFASGNAWLEAAIASTQWACEAMGLAHPNAQALTLTEHTTTIGDPSRGGNVDACRYPQVFEDRLGFVNGRSILDVLFHPRTGSRLLTSRHGNDDLA